MIGKLHYWDSRRRGCMIDEVAGIDFGHTHFLLLNPSDTMAAAKAFNSTTEHYTILVRKERGQKELWLDIAPNKQSPQYATVAF